MKYGTEEWKKRHSIQLKGKLNLKNRGRVLSEETRRKMSISHTGVKRETRPENLKKIISEKLKQRNREHPRAKINNGVIAKYIEKKNIQEWLGKGWFKGPLPYTAERKANMGKSRIGMHHSDETKRKIREKRLGGKGYIKGKVPINNGLKSIYVTPEELDSYVKQGWSRGKLFRQIKPEIV